MQLSTFFRLLSLATFPTAATASANLSALANLSSIDMHFSANFQRGDQDLSDKSVYMATLKAMVKMSQHVFTHRCPGGRWIFSSYSDVEILVEPAVASDTIFQWRFALWGLYLTTKAMADGNFISCRGSLFWAGLGDSELVGYVSVQKPACGIAGNAVMLPNSSIEADVGMLSTSLSSSSLQRRGTANMKPVSSTPINTTTVSASGINIAIDITGRRLPKYGVFMAIYIGIMIAASLERSLPIPSDAIYKAGEAQTGTLLKFEPWAVPRTSPPYFSPKAAIAALATIPGFMYSNHKFNEIRFVVEVEGAPVGYGWMRHQVPPPRSRPLSVGSSN